MFFLFTAVGAALVLLSHVAPFPFLLDLMAPAPSHWSMRTDAEGPRVYLTFDDGPNPTATPALLDVLARENAVATFFVLDRHLDAETAPMVTRMFDEGHAVALHSHTRVLMVLPPDQIAARLQAAADHIEHLTGHRPCRAFRPHGGWRSGQMYEGLALIDHVLVGWGWFLWDWDWFRTPDPTRLVRRLAGRVSDGDIVVMHDGHHENGQADRRYAVEATGRLIPVLRERGFTFGTIC